MTLSVEATYENGVTQTGSSRLPLNPHPRKCGSPFTAQPARYPPVATASWVGKAMLRPSDRFAIDSELDFAVVGGIMIFADLL